MKHVARSRLERSLVRMGMRRQRHPLPEAMSQELSTETKDFVDSGTFPVAASVATVTELRPRLGVDEVTLVVYGWHNVEPGTLSWVFPSLTAALNAARAMRNAVKWVVVRGKEMMDLALARESGAVLAESAA